MKKNGILLILGMFLLISNMVAGLTPTNLIMDFDNTKVDTTLRAGESGVLQIVIKNTGEQFADKVVVKINDGVNIKAQGRFDIGRIDAGTSKTISKVIRVDSDASPGLHTLSVIAVFDRIDSDGKRTDDVEQRWEIPVRIYGNPNFQLAPTYNEFYKGVTAKMTLKGSARTSAKGASAKITSTCVNVVGSSKKYIGDLKQDEAFRLDYTIKPSVTGACTIAVVMEYFDSRGVSTEESLTLGIDVQPSEVNFKVVDIEPDTLTYGSKKNFTIKLINLGTSGAKDVTAKLNITEPFTALKTSEKYLGDIGPKKKGEVVFTIIVDTSAKKTAYEIPLILEYYDASGTKQTKEIELGVQIAGKSKLDLVLESSDNFVKGAKGKIKIGIMNSAFTNVKFLNIKFLPTDFYSIVSADEVYIGNLDSDDTDSEEFTIKLGKDVPNGNIDLKVELTYREEGSNEEYTEIRTVPLKVLTSEEFSQMQPSDSLKQVLGLVFSVVGIFVLVIVVWFMYRLLKLVISILDRKIFKRNNKNNKKEL